MVTVILQFFGRILLFIYNFCHSYALTLAIFTLLIKLVLFPLSYKGKQSMMRMNSMNEEMQRLKKQYGKDQQRYNLEVQKMYEEEHINPMSGCLWSMLPLPILMGLYYVIRKPMFYMLCLTNEQIETVKNVVTGAGVSLDGVNAAYQEINILNTISQNPDLFAQAQSALGDSAGKLQAIDFRFIGIDLGTVPQWQFWKWDSVDWNHIGLFLIPIAVTALNFFYSRFSMKSSQVKRAGQDEDSSANPAAQSSQTMMLMMPLMYLWFGFIMPAGMCVYMACNAVFSALQELLFAKVLNKKFQQEDEERQARLAAKRDAEKAKKAEIAARRAAEEAELLKKGGKKALKQAQKKERKDTGAGALGVRRYARGRSYDPDRYPSTSYSDPNVVDEEALEQALSRKGRGGHQDSED